MLRECVYLWGVIRIPDVSPLFLDFALLRVQVLYTNDGRSSFLFFSLSIHTPDLLSLARVLLARRFCSLSSLFFLRSYFLSVLPDVSVEQLKGASTLSHCCTRLLFCYCSSDVPLLMKIGFTIFRPTFLLSLRPFFLRSLTFQCFYPIDCFSDFLPFVAVVARIMIPRRLSASLF